MSLDPACLRLQKLRDELGRQGLDGFIVPRADEHLGEYVPASAERLAWLTGFTGSAGLAVVLADRAAVFTDGRYVAAARRTRPIAALWERRTSPNSRRPPGSPSSGAGRRPDRLRPAADQRGGAGALHRRRPRHGARVDANPIDAIWTDRPAAAGGAGRAASAGVCRARHRRRSGPRSPPLLREAQQDAAVLTDPASIAWLLNIRGGDVPFTPFALGFALVHADGATELFMDPAKLPPETRAWLGNAVSIADRRRAGTARWRGWPARRCGSIRRLAGLVRAARCARPARRWWRAPTPACCRKPARTAAEQQGARAAHARDAVAVCRFLHWLSATRRRAAQTEISAADTLLAFRARGRRLPRRELPGDLRRRRAWRDHPLPRHRRSPTGRSGRTRSI